MNKLLVFQLSIQSSYAEDQEFEAEENSFDTLQWWFSETETWRIRTFAVDKDIHTHCIAGLLTEEVAIQNTNKHYGDVIANTFSVEFKDLNNPAEVSTAMEKFGGPTALEAARNGAGFAFWNPLRSQYSSKTQPS